MKNCIINSILNGAKRSEGSRKLIFPIFSGKVLALLFFLLTLPLTSFSQDITLEYIFQDTAIINPRPSLKFIHADTKKIYYYADDDYDGMLSLFDMNYESGEKFKYSDTGETASEFVVMPNGNAVTIINGDVYVTKDFVNSRSYTRDIQLTETDKYEYSPQVIGNFVIHRRSGNYYLTRHDSIKANSNELALTVDESDSVSYQVIDMTDKFKGDPNCVLRLFVARYDNTTKRQLVFPDYNDKFVKAETRKRGISKVKLFDISINQKGKDSLYKVINEFVYPDSQRYSTTYAEYSPDGSKLLLDIETMDRHSRKLFIYDVSSENVKEIYSETDPAWYERHSNSSVFIDSQTVLFESEVTGYNNLHKVNIDGTGFTSVTPGHFTVLASVVDRAAGKIYYVANAEVPYNYNIYSADIYSSNVTKLTNADGDVEDLKISRDGKYLFYSHSYINKPNELYAYNLQTGEEKQLTNTASPKFTAIDWNLPELITFNNDEDGQLIYGFVYKPKNFNPKKKYPLICFVHGAGYLQNVTNGFSPYRDNFMVNTFITQNDFVVLDLDFRGSMGYGKEFRNRTYRNLGYWEVSDYISGINFLDS
ncbi:MAG TPA: DPP IV N-terminal domain-containing protein, partial [Ignavibacteria bacterium]|nr:DPP IV N-terminal domain-containing protein [Ignavibacteria bacterium]